MGSRKTTQKEKDRFAYEVSRRDFLKYCLAASSGALFLDPVRILMGALVDGLIQKAQAQTTGLEVKKLLSLVLLGGPPRWVFDLPLFATGDGNPNNRMVATKIENGGRVYKTVRMGEYHFPALWDMGLPMHLGGMTMSMEPLAKNALIIRGIKTINSHEAGRVMVTRPNVASPSLNGLVADHSHASVPAVNLAAMQTFKSYSGVGEFRITNLVDNPLSAILGPFIEDRSGSFFTRRKDLDKFVEEAMRALRSHHEAGTPGVSALYENSDKAEKQIRSEISNLTLTGAYGYLLNKYTGIIDRVASASDWTSKMGFDLTGLSFNSTQKIQNLAPVFAITEYLFSNNYSSTIHASIDYINATTSSSKPNESTIDNDAHDVDADTHLRAFSFYFRAIAACIYELSRSLKDWDNTVVQVGSEFARTPRDHKKTREGSDHAWEGTVSSIFSGAIRNGPYLAGNIQEVARKDDEFYPGVWGKAAPVKFDASNNETIMGMGNLASAIAHIVGVQSPTSNFESPVYLSNGVVSNRIGSPTVKLIT